jgi:hypothetical protein
MNSGEQLDTPDFRAVLYFRQPPASIRHHHSQHSDRNIMADGNPIVARPAHQAKQVVPEWRVAAKRGGMDLTGTAE